MTEPTSQNPRPDEPAWLPSGEDSHHQKRLNRLAANPSVITGIWIVSAILNVLFLGSIVVLALLYGNNTTALHNANVSQCQQNNQNRRQDIAIWNQFLADLAPVSAQTPKVKAELDQINALISIKDTPRNCVQIYNP